MQVVVNNSKVGRESQNVGLNQVGLLKSQFSKVVHCTALGHFPPDTFEGQPSPN